MKNTKHFFTTALFSAFVYSSFSYAAVPVSNQEMAANPAATSAGITAPTSPEIAASSYVLMDYNSGVIIAEKNMHERRHPASLTKMLTSYVIGQNLKLGNISNSDMVKISEKAWAKNFPDSSKMFIEVGKTVSVAELNRGIVIASGNDASVAMAEYIATSEDKFVDMMNDWAKKIGMEDSYFANSHGLDNDAHYSTAYDLALLGAALIRDVPEEYALYAQKEFTYNNITQYNRNSLLWDNTIQVDGIKTGHTSGAGYNLVSSAVEGNMRLVAVVMGTDSEKARKSESKKLLTYGFRYFETITPHREAETLTTQRIWFGDKEEIALGVSKDTTMTIPRNQADKLKASFQLNGSLKAPINKGDVVGTVYYRFNGEDKAEFDLVAKEAVAEAGFFSRMWDHVALFFTNLF